MRTFLWPVVSVLMFRANINDFQLQVTVFSLGYIPVSKRQEMVRTWPILPQLPYAKLPSSLLPSVGQESYPSLCRCWGTSTTQMLMTCILTSSAGSRCSGQTNQPGSEMPPSFSQGILCIDQEVVWDNVGEAAEICSWGCPQSMPAAGQCRGSPGGLTKCKASLPVQERCLL